MKVLAIDDQQLILLSVEKRLSELGYQVKTANSGKSGIAAIDSFDPDMVIVDINMPQMNAWEFLDSLSTDCCLKKKNNLKLFVASFSDNPKDINAANEHRLVTSFIHKENLIPSMTNYLKVGIC